MNYEALCRHIEVANPLTIVDVGARGGIQKRWERVAKNTPFLFVGFEPDEQECAVLNQDSPDNYRYIAKALSSRAHKKTIYITRSSGNSSVYPPDSEFVQRFTVASQYDVLHTASVQMQPLDGLNEELDGLDIDFIKMDVEGSELDIIQGAGRTLESVFGVEVEIWFNTIYKGQPLFADVDRSLRELGFHLFDVARSNFFTRNPGREIVRPKGQLMAGDAVYFRDLLQMAPGAGFWAKPKFAKCLAILLTYGFYDYVMELLNDERVNGLCETGSIDEIRYHISRATRMPPNFKGRYRLSEALKKLGGWLSLREVDFLGNR